MAIRYTGSTTTGFAVSNSGDTWITRPGEALDVDGVAFDFGTFDDTTFFLQGDISSTSFGISADDACQ